METQNDESPPNIFRAGPLDMVFDNEFADSDDECEDVSALHVNEVPLFESNRPNCFSEEDNSSVERVTGLDENEQFPERFEDNLETNTRCDSSYSRKDRPVVQTLSDEISNDDAAGSETLLQRHINENSDSDDFTTGWELNEEDLLCLPLILNKTRIEECKATKAASLKKPSSEKGKKKNAMKLFMKSTGLSRIVYMPPLTKIANYAKKLGYDLQTLLETSEFKSGSSIHLPCMQCYEKLGTYALSSLMGGAMSGEAGSSNGRCSICGGQVQTLAAFGTMIRQLRDIMDAKSLVPHDVHPDGNCLFAAVVDQLRVRGDFSFTTLSLRQSAVNYLRKNPTADDGTPLYMFLTDNETWESYLTRMSKDGEWGDHMILSAIANVMQMHIVIYGGATGQRETILSPKSLTRERVKPDSEKSPQEENNVIYLGHVVESHYMSLRPKAWRQSLREGLQKRSSTLKSTCPQTPAEEDRVKCPVQLINLILRQVFRMNFIKSSCSEFVDLMVPSRYVDEDTVYEIFGSVICKMAPRKVKVESFEPDISMFFPSVKEAADGGFQTPTLTYFNTPYDTEVVTTKDFATSVDLIADNDTVVVGRMLLIPNKPRIWKGQTASLNGDKTCLKQFEVNIDFDDLLFPKREEKVFNIYNVLGFKCAWPDVAKEWPQRYRKFAFPDQQTITTVVELGCHVIPLLPNAKMADIFDDPLHLVTSLDDHNWCYSFVAAEKEICRFISSAQRQCFLIFKSLVDITLKDIAIPSSIVRNIFFYACEKIDKPCWQSKPGECFLILLKKITESFKNGNVPHYFMREKNLLNLIPEKTLAECYYRLDCARLQPVVTLYFLLEQLNVISSKIGSFVEEIIGNIDIDDQTSAEMGPSNKALLPACTELLHSLIYQNDYHGAMLVFQDIMEERGKTLLTDGVAVVKELLWDMYIGHQWCFALYVDMKQQTTMTTQLCGGYEAVHVTEVFGPNCIEELPDTLVPECFSIRKGDLIFLLTVSYILQQNMSSKMYIRCMKFYLKQYAELAGESLVLPSFEFQLVHAISGSKPVTVSCTCGSCQMLLSSYLNTLHNIYTTLFNFCCLCCMSEEFREMMPVYTSIVERIGSHLCLINLPLMWTCLGEHKKAAEARRKHGVAKGRNVLSATGHNFREYDLD